MCVYQRKKYLDPASTEQIFVPLHVLEANSSNYTHVVQFSCGYSTQLRILKEADLITEKNLEKQIIFIE
jgi:hypothetical protein